MSASTPTRSASAAAESARYDGCSAADLAGRLGVPSVVIFDTVGSTLDAAHARAAAGAPAGTLVLADAQTAGRGRQGRPWISEHGAGIWLTLVERPQDALAVEVLSLRLGLFAANALDPFAPERIGLKWPNDLCVAGRKVAGILVEARWREGAVDWVAVGFGLNLQAPVDMPTAGGLRGGTGRLDVLAVLVPALRAAAAERGPLRPAELAAYAGRDVSSGRRCRAPLSGVVTGVDASGALVIETDAGTRCVRAGSLVFQEDP
jgi:BirA family transcriptional regulator, biotin operon repressor / biotin---[acetyl-CoA-carboxylase] ligase